MFVRLVMLSIIFFCSTYTIHFPLCPIASSKRKRRQQATTNNPPLVAAAVAGSSFSPENPPKPTNRGCLPVLISCLIKIILSQSSLLALDLYTNHMFRRQLLPSSNLILTAGLHR